MRLATVILFLVAVPLVCIAVGQLAAHLAQRQATPKRRQSARSPPSCSRRCGRTTSRIRTPQSR